jgi:hypothetical protein
LENEDDLICKINQSIHNALRQCSKSKKSENDERVQTLDVLVRTNSNDEDKQTLDDDVDMKCLLKCK